MLHGKHRYKKNMPLIFIKYCIYQKKKKKKKKSSFFPFSFFRYYLSIIHHINYHVNAIRIHYIHLAPCFLRKTGTLSKKTTLRDKTD